MTTTFSAILHPAQVERAIRAMNSYLSSSSETDSSCPLITVDAQLDKERIALIQKQLGPAVAKFLAGTLPVSEFKPEIDSINKKNQLWGFKGVKGQMFFNLAYNASVDEAELAAELKAALEQPETEDIAKSRIRNFQSYIRRLGENLVEGGGSKHARPKLSSIPFFLSYFWQIQAPDQWPVYYTNSLRVLSNLNLYEPVDDLAEAYIGYVRLHRELQLIFSKASVQPFTLYQVEHVWWHIGKEKPVPVAAVQMVEQAEMGSDSFKFTDAELPDSYIPPIVAIIPALSANDGTLDVVAKGAGTSVPAALEKSVHAAFTILGYDTHQLGQGLGRVPDGLAIAHDYSYAILWDAKARQNGYRMGIDDRTIREYITTQSRLLKRKYRLLNLYYVVVSSRFPHDFDELIRGLKMETEVNEVCLMESEVLPMMVDAKLRDPIQVTLGPDGLQRIFCRSGVLTASDVYEDQT